MFVPYPKTSMAVLAGVIVLCVLGHFFGQPSPAWLYMAAFVAFLELVVVGHEWNRARR